LIVLLVIVFVLFYLWEWDLAVQMVCTYTVMHEMPLDTQELQRKKKKKKKEGTGLVRGY